MREAALGDKHHLRKSADRKAQIRKAFVPLTGLICAFRSADFLEVVFIPRAQPHAQSLFLFPIDFGINFNPALPGQRLKAWPACLSIIQGSECSSSCPIVLFAVNCMTARWACKNSCSLVNVSIFIIIEARAPGSCQTSKVVGGDSQQSCWNRSVLIRSQLSGNFILVLKQADSMHWTRRNKRSKVVCWVSTGVEPTVALKLLSRAFGQLSVQADLAGHSVTPRWLLHFVSVLLART